MHGKSSLQWAAKELMLLRSCYCSCEPPGLFSINLALAKDVQLTDLARKLSSLPSMGKGLSAVAKVGTRGGDLPIAKEFDSKDFALA